MNIVFGFIILLALSVILLLLRSLLQKYSLDKKTGGAQAVVLSLFLVSVAVWGRYFLEIRIPGFADLTIDRFFLSLIIAIIVFGLYFRRVTFGRGAFIEFIMLLFVIVCCISMACHGFNPELPELPSPWGTFLTGYLFPFIVFFFAKYFLQDKKDMLTVFYSLFFLGVYLSITSFFEFFGIHEFVFPRYISNPEIPLHLDRARGPLLNAAFNGAAITFGFICGIHILPGKKGIAKIVHAGLLCLYFPAIFFTQTRSVYLGFFITLAVLLCFYYTSFPKWKVLALPVAFFLVFLMANIPRLTSEERREGGVLQIQELEVRMALMQRSMRMIMLSPFFGVGMSQFMPVSSENFPGEVTTKGYQEQLQHFHILGMVIELGIVGAGLYFMLLALIFRRLYQLRTLLPLTGFISRNLLLAITVIWVVYLVTNLLLEPSYCLFYNAVPFMCAGIADGVYRRCIV